MKCKGNLWDGMISFENLLRAAHAAARGKRFKPGVARFFFHLEPQTPAASRGTRRPDLPPRSLPHVHDLRGQDPADQPAPFRDRVVHHALTGVLEPIFDSNSHPHSDRMTHDSIMRDHAGTGFLAA